MHRYKLIPEGDIIRYTLVAQFSENIIRYTRVTPFPFVFSFHNKLGYNAQWIWEALHIIVSVMNDFPIGRQCF